MSDMEPHEMRVCPACQGPDATRRLLLESRAEVARLRAGIAACLAENAHLADGDNCTLAGLKRLVGR